MVDELEGLDGDNTIPQERVVAALQGATGYKFAYDSSRADKEQFAALVPIEKASALSYALREIAMEAQVRDRGIVQGYDYPRTAHIHVPLKDLAKQVRYVAEQLADLPKGKEYTEVLIPPAIACDEQFLTLVANRAIDIQRSVKDCAALGQQVGGSWIGLNGSYTTSTNGDGKSILDALDKRGIPSTIGCDDAINISVNAADVAKLNIGPGR
jgi:hypothetical protein